MRSFCTGAKTKRNQDLEQTASGLYSTTRCVPGMSDHMVKAVKQATIESELIARKIGILFYGVIFLVNIA